MRPYKELKDIYYKEWTPEESASLTAKEKLKALDHQFRDYPYGAPYPALKELGIEPKPEPRYQDLTLEEKSQMTVRQKVNIIEKQYELARNSPEELINDAKTSPSISEIELTKRNMLAIRDKIFGSKSTKQNMPE